MARIIFGSWMVRYPLGGNLSWALQYLLGLKELGHDVFFVEKAGYPDSCYNPLNREMSDDCSYGIKIVLELFVRFGLEKKWCFVDNNSNYWGLSKKELDEIFRTADLFIDSGSHGNWAEESLNSGLRVLIEGEPAYTQMKWANNAAAGIPVPTYDHYFTNGRNVGIEGNQIPTLNVKWGHVYSPVKTDLFSQAPVARDASYSTIMNWRSHNPIQHNGNTYGQKDEEFKKFLSLPKLVDVPMSIAVSGKDVPEDLLRQNGWVIHNGQKETLSFNSFCKYLSASRGEFSICKNVFVANSTGWFSDKSAAYLASGKPVILQETGFSKYLPVGQGLFAVEDIREAKEAIGEIESNYSFHSSKAREIACEYLEAKKVMGKFLDELGF